MSQQQATIINIFVDYHINDESIAKELLTYLSALKYQFNIKVWHHGKIRAGQRRDVLQAQALGEADIILLFMSADYLNSPDYQTYEKEFARLSESGAATLIPIRAKTSMWLYSDIGRLGLQALPRESGTIFHARDKSQTYTKIVEDLVPIIEEKLATKPVQQAKFEKELEEKIEQTQNKQEATKERGTEKVVKEEKKASFQDYIKDLIGENDVKKAFEEIDKVLKYSNDTKLKSYFALFKSRYYRAENDMMMGRITSENMYVEHTRILESLMASLDKIPEGISQQKNVDSSAVYLDSIIKVSEDKKADVIQNIKNKLNKSNTIKGNGNNTNFQDAAINAPITINMGGNNNSNQEEGKKKKKVEKKKEQEEKIKAFQETIDVLKEQIQQDIDYDKDLKIKYDDLNNRFSVFQRTQHSLKRKAQIQQLEVFEKEYGGLLQKIKRKEISNTESKINNILKEIQKKNTIQEFKDLYKETQKLQNKFLDAKSNDNISSYKHNLSKIENETQHLLTKVEQAYLIKEKQTAEALAINNTIRHLESDFKTLVENEKLQAFEKEYEQLDEQLANIASMDYDSAIQQYKAIKKYWQELPNKLAENLKLREEFKKIEQKEQTITLYFKDKTDEVNADKKKIAQIKRDYNNITIDGLLDNKNKDLERIKKAFNNLLEIILPKEIELKEANNNTKLEEIEKELDKLQKRIIISYQNENLDNKLKEIENIKHILQSHFEKSQ